MLDQIWLFASSLVLSDPEFARGLHDGHECFSDSYDVANLPTESEIIQVIREQTSPVWLSRMGAVAQLTGIELPSPVYRAGLLAGWLQAYSFTVMEANHAI